MASGLVLFTLLAAVASDVERPALMPWPSSIELSAGELPVGPGFRVSVTGKGGALVERAAERLAARVSKQTGIRVPDPVAPPARGSRSAAPLRASRCRTSAWTRATRSR